MIHPDNLGKLSSLIRGIPATLRQAFLGKEIKSTFADTAAVNQLPQSGIHGQLTPQFIHSMIVTQPSFLIGIMDSNTLIGKPREQPRIIPDNPD